MELDTEQKAAPSHDALEIRHRLTDNFGVGRLDYDLGDYDEALAKFVEAFGLLEDPDSEATPQLKADVTYYLFKAYVRSSHWNRDTRFKLPISYLKLEKLVENDSIDERARAARWTDRYGRLGLRLHELLEHYGY